MSNPTTPFGWQMPENTDLVTDLPADFEVFGQAVATSMTDLLGGTTGQLLSKTSNTDMDFTWTNANPGDITGVTAGTGISGGGTSGDVTITNSMATAIDAKGDLVAGTGADAFSRLAVGANDTVLVADSSTATGLKWATPASGGMTLISTTTLSGASITLSSIPATYNNLQLVFRDFLPATDNAGLLCRVNNISTSDTYRSLVNSTTEAANFNQNSWNFTANDGNDNAVANGKIIVTIYDYANADTYQVAKVDGVTTSSTTPATDARWYNNACFLKSTVAVSSLVLFPSTGNFTSGTVLLYGVK